MNIDYKILWFEDDKDWYDSIQSFIESYLTENGFNFIPSRFESGAEIEKILEDNGYDLILVDYNLPGELGDKLIERLRRFDLYTDVIFYSQNGAEKVRQALQEKAVEGIYCSGRGREDFEEKVQNVIWTTIKKVQDLNNMRGLVIASVSELDLSMYDIILEKTNKLHDADKAKFKQKIKERFLESLNDRVTTIEKIDLDTNYLKLLQKLESYHRWIAVKDICHDSKDLTEYKKNVETYFDEIIKIRNKLAHIREELSADNKKILKSTLDGEPDFIFDDALCIDIRSKIKKHSETFKKIKELI